MTKLDYSTYIWFFDFNLYVDIYEDLYKENGEKYEYFPSKKELVEEVCKFARETYEDKFDVFFFDTHCDEETFSYVKMSLVPNLYSDYMEYYLDDSRFEWDDDGRSYMIGFNIGGYVADKLGLSEFYNKPTWGDWETIIDAHLFETEKENFIGKSYEKVRPIIQTKLEEVKKCWLETEQKAIAEIELIQSKEFEQSFYDHMADYIDKVAVLKKE